jgi:hypothetical protein
MNAAHTVLICKLEMRRLQLLQQNEPRLCCPVGAACHGRRKQLHQETSFRNTSQICAMLHAALHAFFSCAVAWNAWGTSQLLWGIYDFFAVTKQFAAGHHPTWCFQTW